MITAVNATKYFGEVAAVNDINVTIKNRAVFGLIGTNGAGKSTFLRMAAGVLKPDSGKIFVDDTAVYENPSVKADIFYISDEQYFCPTLHRGKWQVFMQIIFLHLTEYGLMRCSEISN